MGAVLTSNNRDLECNCFENLLECTFAESAIPVTKTERILKSKEIFEERSLQEVAISEGRPSRAGKHMKAGSIRTDKVNDPIAGTSM